MIKPRIKIPNQPRETDDEVPSAESLRKTAELAKEKLAKVSTVFPFVLFPNKIVVDINKVDIINTHFFYSRQVFTILIKDLVTVRISTSYFFATLYFEIQGYETNPEPISFLDKQDAYTLKRIILGLITCHREKVDLTKLGKDKVKDYLLEIGKANENLNKAI